MRTEPPAGPGTRRGRVGPAARAVVLTVLLASVFTLVNAIPAAAHIAGGGGSPTNDRVRVTAIRPAVPTMAVSVGLGGEWVRVANRGAVEIVVLGAEGEPLLRLSGHRVQVNELSDTASAAGLVSRPAAVGYPPTTVKWTAQDDGDQVSWADPRLRPVPGEAGRTSSWELPVLVDGQQVTVLGTVQRLAPPATWLWLAALGLLAAGVSALGWVRNWHRPIAVVVAAGILAFGLHLVGTGLAPQEGAALLTWAGVGAVGGFALLIGAVTVTGTLRRSEAAPDRVVTTGIMVLLLAATDISVLWNAQLPFAGPAVLDRVLTVLTYAVALGLLVAGGRLARRTRRARLTGQPDRHMVTD